MTMNTQTNRWTSTLLDSWMVCPASSTTPTLACAIERRKWDGLPALNTFYRLVVAAADGPVTMVQANNIEAVLAFLDRLNRTQ